VKNDDIQFSLLLPTRGRAPLVRRLFDSLVQMTADLRCLEVVLYIDEDDGQTQKISHPTLCLIKIVGRPRQTMGYMNRTCCDASHGRYVMLLNDDAVCRTEGWDARVLDAWHRFPDQVALVYGNDLDQSEAVPTFPILSRIVCEVLGEICPRGYRNLHIESHLLDIFRQLSKLGHNRICYLHDVVFEHMHPAVGKAPVDSTYVKKNQRADDLLFIALDQERAFRAKLLARHIEAGQRQAFDAAGETESKIRKPTRGRSALMARLRRLLS